MLASPLIAALLLALAPEKIAWELARGSLQRGLLPSSFVLATDASPSRFSDGEMVSSRNVALPYRLEVAWRRLGPESGRSLHVSVVGGIVLVKSGAVALWSFSDTSRFAKEGWTRVPGMRTNDAHAIAVEQDQRTISVSIDGVLIKQFGMRAARGEGRVGVGLKGASGHRTRLYVRSLEVTEGQAPPRK
jgi:hypothetical protein